MSQKRKEFPRGAETPQKFVKAERRQTIDALIFCEDALKRQIEACDLERKAISARIFEITDAKEKKFDKIRKIRELGRDVYTRKYSK